MTTKQKTNDLVDEERQMQEEIERLEAERRELETPASLPTWQEIEAGSLEDLERRERRRGIIGRLIVAVKVRLLEIRRERYERDAEPLRKVRDEAHGKLKAATAKRLRAVDEENEARFQWTNALRRIENREGYAKSISREIRELRGEG